MISTLVLNCRHHLSIIKGGAVELAQIVLERSAPNRAWMNLAIGVFGIRFVLEFAYVCPAVVTEIAKNGK